LRLFVTLLIDAANPRLNIGTETGARLPRRKWPFSNAAPAVTPELSVSTLQWTAVVRRNPSDFDTEFLQATDRKPATGSLSHRARFVGDMATTTGYSDGG